jgi:hypothetical protein
MLPPLLLLLLLLLALHAIARCCVWHLITNTCLASAVRDMPSNPAFAFTGSNFVCRRHRTTHPCQGNSTNLQLLCG